MEKEADLIQNSEFCSDGLDIKKDMDKFVYWERKLLDLSLRNTLINFRFNKSAISLLTPDIHVMEDSISKGKSFQILERPQGYEGMEGSIPESLVNPEQIKDFIAAQAEKNKWYSLYDKEALAESLKKIYKISKNALEEIGSNTLYLALGLLRWYEDKKNTVARYAPLILLPLEMERKKFSAGYSFKMRDEEILLNTTLFEYLKQNFGIRIPALNELPTDENGLDTGMILGIVKEAVADMQGWEIVEAAVIANLSFSQFVMWKDLHENKTLIEKHPMIQSLLTGVLEKPLLQETEHPQAATHPDATGEEGLYIPVPLDASQQRALHMANAGKSFVLHGPPGTGKSQTITAMIADALGKGRSVLFVAEKKAALDVVKKRLEALGIGDFCLELHSNKTSKRAVLEQFKRVLDLQGSVDSEETDYERAWQAWSGVKQELDTYAHALHKKRAFGKSVRELIDMYEAIGSVAREIYFDKDFIKKLSVQDIDIQRSALERLAVSMRDVHNDDFVIFRPIRQREYHPSMKLELEHIVEEYHTATHSFAQKLSDIFAKIGMDEVYSEADKENAFALIKSAHFVLSLPPVVRNIDTPDAIFVPLFLYLEKERKVEEKKRELCRTWHETFLKQDMQEYQARYAKANKKFFGKKKAIEDIHREILSFAISEPDMSKIMLHLTEIAEFQQSLRDKEQSYAALEADKKELLCRYADRKSLEVYQKEIKENLSIVDSRLSAIKTGALEEGILRNLASLYADMEAFLSWEASLSKLLDVNFEDTEQAWMVPRLRLVQALQGRSSEIKNWILYRKSVYECEALGLAEVCKLYEEGVFAEDVAAIYLKSVYKAIIYYAMEEEEVLYTFTGTAFEERIARFKLLDEELQEATKKEIYYKLVSHIPKMTASVQLAKELGILRKAVAGNGRGISIRKLLMQVDSLLRRIKPCILMSPISVSNYLSAHQEVFDMLIFDEASQLQTAKAIGVLARAKAAIIVGDPNQMPPTSFFANQSLEEDNPEMEDLESILDDTLALGISQTPLRWHYRSRHESLIAFSNREFYDNRMRTFPSVNDLEKKVRYIRVDGRFAKGKSRTNAEEAHAIVAEVKRRYADESLKHDSIGIITFNINQQSLIEDLLAKEFKQDENFDIWANEREESLFVKNLENVQGDERDVILFSITFAPDEEGSLSLNFGPLNKEGGYRRLNVAITRARQEMMIFTAISSEMIDLRRTKARGVEALKSFLEFAQRGKLTAEYESGNQVPEDGIAQSICKALEEAGYTCHRSLGHSEFKLDIAVKHATKEQYLLGILLDGETYRKTSETRDREISGISILSGLGWRIHRIWAIDFWENKEKEIQKVLQLLETLQEDTRS